jgi:hypothetical protein
MPASQAGRRRFDPGRPLQKSSAKSITFSVTALAFGQKGEKFPKHAHAKVIANDSA